MNKVHSINNRIIVNGADMKNGDFGIVMEVTCDSPSSISIFQPVFKSGNRLICLEDGAYSIKLSWHEVEIKNSLTLQRIE